MDNLIKVIINKESFEKERNDILLLNLRQRKDRLKQRDSGFNQVLAKAAKSNNIKIGINFDEIADEKDIIEKKQNERNIYDLKSLGSVMGMPSWMLAG